MRTYRMPLKNAQIESIQAEIAQGKLVVVPTDTVYGIGANPFDRVAVERLLTAKKRGRDFPSPVLLGEKAQLEGLVRELPESALKLISQFWPGALTLILPAKEIFGWDLEETKGTVALRIPAHGDLCDLLKEIGPLAVTSANLHGMPPAINVTQAQTYFHDEVAIYCDSGETSGLIPSTIVAVEKDEKIKIIREGAISAREIDDFLLR